MASLCVVHEPETEYHGKARQYLSSHQLGDFRSCPELYHRKKSGLVPDVDRPAYLIGRAAHCLMARQLQDRAGMLPQRLKNVSSGRIRQRCQYFILSHNLL